MKTIIVFVACIAFASAGIVPFNVPVHYKSDNPEHPEAQILQFHNDNNGVGPYNFKWVFPILKIKLIPFFIRKWLKSCHTVQQIWHTRNEITKLFSNGQQLDAGWNYLNWSRRSIFSLCET